MTRFKVGDRVRSSVTAQGLVAGGLFVVVAVEVQTTPFGGFVSLKLRPEGGRPEDGVWVSNGHLLLSKELPA